MPPEIPREAPGMAVQESNRFAALGGGGDPHPPLLLFFKKGGTPLHSAAGLGGTPLPEKSLARLPGNPGTGTPPGESYDARYLLFIAVPHLFIFARVPAGSSARVSALICYSSAAEASCRD